MRSRRRLITLCAFVIVVAAEDEQHVACIVPESKYDAWLIENFDPDVR